MQKELFAINQELVSIPAYKAINYIKFRVLKADSLTIMVFCDVCS
jgi:hypothetical protein